MRIYFLQYEVSPHVANELFAEVGGAYVNCWVKAASPQEAYAISNKSLVDQSWLVLSLQTCELGDPEEMGENDTEMFQEAEQEGEAYLFHTWPNEPQEGEALH